MRKPQIYKIVYAGYEDKIPSFGILL